MSQWLILHTVVTAALAAVVLAASRWFRLGPAVRHLLWLIVLVKFLTPPVVSWPWALPTLEPTPQAAAPAPVAVRTVVIDMPPDSWPEPDAAEAPPPAPAAAPPVETAPVAPPFTWDWLPATTCWAWLASGVLVALREGMRILRWRRRLARGASAPDKLECLVRELAASMSLRPPRLIVLPRIASPMVWCFGAPRLLWPLGLEDRLSAEGRRAVLLHELAHLRRRDHWVGWLLLAGGCVWWWHPLFWWVRRRLSQEAELACDACVVDAEPTARRAYAEALLEVSQRTAAAAAAPALGAAGGRRDLERRLVMIMRGPASRRLSWVGLAGVIALGLLALPAWTLGEDKTLLPTVSTPPPMAATSAPHTAFAEGPPAPPTAADPLLAPDAAPRTPPVPSQPVAPGSSASKDPALLRDRKLKELEDNVQQLLKEMQQLRGQAPTEEKPSTTYQPGGPTDANTEVITLTRVTYKLKAAKAETLASFLKENVKTAILEIKNDGDSLTVTTTPDAQEVIGGLIDLMQGKKPPLAMTYGPPGGSFPPGMTVMPGPGGSMRPGATFTGPWPKFIGPPVAK